MESVQGNLSCECVTKNRPIYGQNIISTQIDLTLIFNQVDNECLEPEVFMESTQVKTGAEGIAQVSDSNEQHAIQVCQSIAAKRINQKLSRVSNRELKRNHKEN